MSAVTQAQQPAAAAPVSLHHGIVKQVLSGDSVIVRGQPRGGPPPERTICLSNVVAPKLARKALVNVENSQDTIDEPYAWEAREYLRQKLIGKEVSFTVEYKVPGSNREYGIIYLGKDTSCENVTESMVSEGFVEVRSKGINLKDESQQNLIQLEESAKVSGKGKWSDTDKKRHVRDIQWTVENPRHFVDHHQNKPLDAIIEYVRDGCTMRVVLTSSFHYITVMLSGIKCPMFKLEADNKQTPELFAEEAKYFTESRLLQREVKIILEGVSNQNFLGTVLHPNGNIAELLLREGFARCIDWSIGVVTQGVDKLRAAEKEAKEARKRIWKDYTPSTSNIEIKDRSFTGKVIEIVNGDSLTVKTNDGTIRKIFLASVRPPRSNPVDSASTDRSAKMRARPLYDIPYMFEAREFLRKKLIGKKVSVEIDYIQPPNQGFPEKTCCTVTISGVNVAEALVSKGLATVIRYRQDDDQRAFCYDSLLMAEARATKKLLGLHSRKEPPIHKVADVSGDLGKAKQFLPFLQRAGKSEAIVEFVASGSRVRVYIPRETCLVTLLLSGISCARGQRPLPNGSFIPGEPYGDEASNHTKELCLHRDGEIEIESMDKGGNFIGWLWIDGINISLSLVQNGFATVHFSAEKSPYYNQLVSAETDAKAKRLNVWSTYVEKEDVAPVEEIKERLITYKSVVVTEICDDLTFYAQYVENGSQLEKLMLELRQEMNTSPPLPGSYTPKKSDMCAAKFSDGEWYRGKIDKVLSNDCCIIFFIDFGNRATVKNSEITSLPTFYKALPPQAHHFGMACIAPPQDEEAKQDAINVLSEELFNRQCLSNVEYRANAVEYVTLLDSDNKDDLIQSLVGEGWLIVDRRPERRLQKLLMAYNKAQEKAKNNRANLWRYGDFTADDAREFGFNG